ncbi:MAG: hypothetical protein HKO65_20425 [Gemmatimonadetes bacterium]|nr:hypothetical protein [Gemmatimonadota bacterium]NNM07468.1 hypothetical protein [Gemmatimonadota bacterium]
MTRATSLFLLAALFPAAVPCLGSAQEDRSATAQKQEPLRVFLDCERFICDSDHFRREVGFISYVRDRMDAQLHVLVTSQATGAGGEEYSFFFIGLRDWQGAQDTLTYTSRPDDTDDETRSGLVQTFKLGLVRYVARTPVGRRLGITYRGPAGEEPPEGPLEDPWDLWVFRIGVSGELEAESRENSRSFDGSISASRTTEDLKLDFRAEGEWNEDRFEFSDGEESSFSSRNFDVEGTVVWSLSPHWSAGATGSATGTTRRNQDLALRAGPAVEYNIFPYAESTQRQITFMYAVEVASFNYEEITLFEKTKETRLTETLQIAAAFEQPWGELDVSLAGSNYLDNFKQHRIELFSRMEVRLFRGLSLDIEGNLARVKDQIYEPKEDIPDEDILLRRRELGTDYELSFEIGFNYTFGSVFNNVVNPRMSTGGGGDRRRH